MRDDLQSLEISQKELQKLTNLPVNDQLLLITNPLRKIVRRLMSKIKGSEGVTVIFIGFSGLVFTYIIFEVILKIFAYWVTVPTWILLITLCFWVGGVTQLFLYLIWWRRSNILKANMTSSLRILLNEVNRYHSVIKAIDINDQIEEAGNPEVSIQSRDKVMEALELTRTDLIRALKTEKILRENQNFILGNTELFVNNLATLTAMQVTEKATEHGRILNEALQIALDVQQEMRHLQSQRSS